MDCREIWDSIGKFFYTATFSVVVSALLVSKFNLFEITTRILTGEWHLSLLLIIIVTLLIYFIFDWLDAINLSKIDKDVTYKDILFWLFAPLFLLSITVLLLKKSTDSLPWLFSGFFMYALIYGIILLKRDSRIDSAKEMEYFEKKDKKTYDQIKAIQRWQKNLGFVFLSIALILICAAITELIFEWINKDYLQFAHVLLFGIFMIMVGINTYVKYRRYKDVNLCLYNQNQG